MEETDAASSIAMKKLSEKQKIIQEQAKLIKKKRIAALKDEMLRIRRMSELMWRWHKGWMNLRRYRLKL